jgi:hypothetical protein
MDSVFTHRQMERRSMCMEWKYFSLLTYKTQNTPKIAANCSQDHTANGLLLSSK